MTSSCRFVLASFLTSACLLVPADARAQTYVIQTVAGSDFVGDDAAAIAAVLSQTEGIAVDGLGTIYVADADDNRVRKITPDGTIHTAAGTGTAGVGGDGGPAHQALLSHPYGVAVDPSGNLYVADLGNARVRKVSSDGTIQTIAGGGSISPANNAGGSPAVNIQLLQPRNLAVDPDGTLYISDFGANQVYRVSPGGILTVFAGTGTAGLAGDGSAAQLAQLNAPAGLASDGNGTLYIADSGNNRIRKISHGLISSLFTVTAPTGLALGSTGTLYVAARNYLGTTASAIAGLPSAFDVALDRAGNLYATTGSYVEEVVPNGQIAIIAGSGASRYFGGDNGPAASARLDSPSGIAFDTSGNAYVADTANHRIRKITPAGIISTIAGAGTAGYAGDNGTATAAKLNAPAGVALDSQANIYIADSGNNAIRKITPGGSISTLAAGFNNPEALAVDSNGSVHVADTGNGRIAKVTASGSVTTLAEVSKPAGIAIDSAGGVFVSESARVSLISSDGTVNVVLDGLSSPRGLAFAPNGDLLIAETGLNVIRRLTPGAKPVLIAGTGAAGFSGDGGSASTAELNSPAGLAVDSNGAIWIADQANDRIRALTPQADAAEVAVSPTIVNAASLAPGSIAPGEIVMLFGAGFEAAQTKLLFNGEPATILNAGPGQIDALAPADLSPNSIIQLSIAVSGSQIATLPVPVVAAAPGIFTTGNGSGPAAANNQDGSVNSESNPAARGSVISFYATGGGSDLGSVTVEIGGYAAQVPYAGPAPGFPGLIQINAQIPAGFLPPGVQPLVMTAGGSASQPGVTIAIR